MTNVNIELDNKYIIIVGKTILLSLHSLREPLLIKTPQNIHINENKNVIYSTLYNILYLIFMIKIIIKDRIVI